MPSEHRYAHMVKLPTHPAGSRRSDPGECPQAIMQSCVHTSTRMVFGDGLRSERFFCPAHTHTAPGPRRLVLRAARAVGRGDRASFHQHRFRGQHQSLDLAASALVFSRYTGRSFVVGGIVGAYVGHPQDGTSGGICRAWAAGGSSASDSVPRIRPRQRPRHVVENGRGRDSLRHARGRNRRITPDIAAVTHGLGAGCSH